MNHRLIKKITIKLTFLLFALMLMPLNVFAESKLPEPMVGQLLVEEYDGGSQLSSFYGGFTGNETVLNYMPSGRNIENLASVDLNGSGSSVKGGPVFDPPTIQTMSVSLWFKNRAALTDPANKYHYLFQQWEWRSVIRIWGNNDMDFIGWGTPEFNVANSSVKDTNWHHIVVSKGTGSVNNLKVYLDGALIKTVSAAGAIDTSVGTKSNEVVIGEGFDGAKMKRYNGNIDEVAVYDRALTQAEVTSLHDGNPVINNPKLYWDFSGDEGGKVIDKSGHHYTGDLVNGAVIDSTEKPIFAVDSTVPELFGFDQNTLVGCVNGMLMNPDPYICFIKNTRRDGVQLMDSKTHVNNVPTTELSILYYPPRVIMGDASLKNFDTSNFSFWGKNLAQKSGGAIDPSSGASWAMNNYSINNGSQSAWNESDPQSAFNKYNEQLQALIRGGTVIASTQITSGSPLYLQTLNSTSINVNIGTGDEQAAKYPEGRVWVVNSPSVSIPANMTVTYHGVGTLIIKGNLIIGDHAKIVAGDPKVDKLGIVVLQ